MAMTRRRLTKGLVARLHRAWLRARMALGAAKTKRCAACGEAVAGFFIYGDRPFGCPFCGATTRERWVATAMEDGLLTPPAKPCRTLHIAPYERTLAERFKTAGPYVGGDIMTKDDVVFVDLTDLSSHGEYDLVYASHVLEHIPDDRKAMREVRDHLSADGEAWFMVPLADAPTEEGHDGMSAQEREDRFGQWDHVRQYGPDIVDRLQEAGFSVEMIDVDRLSAEKRDELGLDENNPVFRCRLAKAA